MYAIIQRFAANRSSFLFRAPKWIHFPSKSNPYLKQTKEFHDYLTAFKRSKPGWYSNTLPLQQNFWSNFLIPMIRAISSRLEMRFFGFNFQFRQIGYYSIKHYILVKGLDLLSNLVQLWATVWIESFFPYFNRWN